MQMFNGLTIGANCYKVNLVEESGDKGNKAPENYEARLNDYTKKINEITEALTNDDPKDDEKAKEAGKNLMNELSNNFTESVKDYFKNNTEKLKSFKATIEKSIQSLKDKNDGNLPTEYRSLQNLLNKINNEFSSELADGVGTNPVELGDGATELADKDKKQPELNLKEVDSLNGIKAVEKNDEDPADKKGEQNFFKGKNETVGIHEIAEGQKMSKLDETRKTIEDQVKFLGNIDESKLPENVKSEVNHLKLLLNNINNAIDNTTSENVKILQKFISENLSDESKGEGKLSDKAKFDSLSQKSDGKTFDGKFGSGTLDGLNIVLGNIQTYINGISENLKQNEAAESLDKVKVKNPLQIEKGKEINPNDWVDGLPEGGNVTIKEGETVDVNKEGEQTVTLVVKLGDKSKEILDVKVKIVEKINTNQNQEILNQAPRHGETLLENSSELATKFGFKDALFLSKIDGINISEEVPGGDKECLMRMGENIYKVKLDSSNNLCPVATEINPKLVHKDGTPAETKVLLSNCDSCIAYLKNKLPDAIKSECTIGWDSIKQDYYLSSHGRALTIEPMTIAGNRVSKDLGTSLAFLNLTNYIRSLGNKKDQDPDVNKKLKVKGLKDSNGKKLSINKDLFGLSKAEDGELKKFKKYNNGEDWRDDWDKKKDNNYKKINLSVVSTDNGTSENGGNTARVEASAVKNPSQVDQGRIVQTVTVNGGANAPKNPEGENSKGKKISLDENTISKLNVDVLENSADVAQKFAIPENAVVYKAKDSDTYYYKEGNDVVCIGLEPGQEWKKWRLGGEEGNSEDINVCPEGKNKLNSILEESLGELLANNLVTDEEKKLISITVVDGKYTFVNGEKKFPINEYVLKKVDLCKNNDASDIKYKLKLVYLTSKYVHAKGEGKRKGELKLDNDGNIVANIDGKDDILISSKELLDYGLDNDKAKENFADYVDVVSLNMFEDENVSNISTSDNLDDDNNVPKLTDLEKENMLSLLKNIPGDIKNDISAIIGKDPSQETKGRVINHLKSLFDKEGNVKIIEKDEEGNKVENTYSVDDFCAKLISGEIDGNKINKIKSYNTASEFVKGQFIKEDTPLPSSDNNTYIRKLKTFTFDSTLNEDKISGVDDITVTDVGIGSASESATVGQPEGNINNPSLKDGVDINKELNKAGELKRLLENVNVDGQSKNKKEVGIMMMLMCGKADDFISKAKIPDSDTDSIFNEVRNSCLTQLDSKGGKDIRDIIDKDQNDKGLTKASLMNLANYITVTDGEKFLEKYIKCETDDQKSALVGTYNDNYSKIWGSVESFVYGRTTGEVAQPVGNGRTDNPVGETNNPNNKQDQVYESSPNNWKQQKSDSNA